MNLKEGKIVCYSDESVCIKMKYLSEYIKIYYIMKISNTDAIILFKPFEFKGIAKEGDKLLLQAPPFPV